MIELSIGMAISAGFLLMAYWSVDDSKEEIDTLTDIGASNWGIEGLKHLHRFQKYFFVFGAGVIFGITLLRAFP